ncbi:hypothetical protein IAQ61_002447 [Plenodomus lingam]|uniref:uncharacterized protein n=1 Tax=Leptosphaeria maculans TaxID=5022 RepID=UPI0033234245|nr:hypothetical protein IAQ61_002447 [Plenodomus lingam]
MHTLANDATATSSARLQRPRSTVDPIIPPQPTTHQRHPLCLLPFAANHTDQTWAKRTRANIEHGYKPWEMLATNDKQTHNSPTT